MIDRNNDDDDDDDDDRDGRDSGKTTVVMGGKCLRRMNATAPR